jgi:NAD(P)-dependent dehydrogenase (short-subunit alcohol dehydrogenase family)
MSAEYLHQLFGLDGQVAVVIGGAGVLGGALCEGIVRAGAHVVVADLSDEGCQRRVEELKRFSPQVSYCTVNVTSRESIENLLAEALKIKGRVEMLVNCAGVNAGSAFLDATDADWDRVMTINLKAVFQACQVFGRHMVAAGGGSILNIGSVTSHLPLSRVFAYSASKAGVVNLTKKRCPRVRQTRRAVQRHLPRLLPRRAEPQAARPGADRQHHASYPDGPFRRAGRADRGGPAVAIAYGRKVHHRSDGERRRRLHRGMVLSGQTNRPSDQRPTLAPIRFIAMRIVVRFGVCSRYAWARLASSS